MLIVVLASEVHPFNNVAASKAQRLLRPLNGEVPNSRTSTVQNFQKRKAGSHEEVDEDAEGEEDAPHPPEPKGDYLTQFQPPHVYFKQSLNKVHF